MAGETVITLIGNLTNDPEHRTTPSGAPVANFTVASTPRTFDNQTKEWKDGETLFMRCAVWREAADNVVDSLTRGTRVIVTGRLQSRTFDTKEGEKRTVIEMQVDEIGPSLRYATAEVTKTKSNGGDSGGRSSSSRSSSSSREERAPRDREERSSRRADSDEDDRGGRDRSERAPRERAPRERAPRSVEDSGDDLDY